ncbi:MAG: hypothetical protein J1F43_09285, partial [Muribaculaceae bacterium]|nr:hypothetical protein [Muribaculaceae bacterium]
AFTCDEIWLSMPHREGDDPRNVVLNEMNKPFTRYALDAAAMEKWDALIALRDGVNKALEDARASGVKKNQDAEIVLSGGGALPEFSEDELAALFIVSKVTVERGEADGINISVKLSEAPKCPRCWNHDGHIGTPGHHAELCDRCAKVLGL